MNASMRFTVLKAPSSLSGSAIRIFDATCAILVVGEIFSVGWVLRIIGHDNGAEREDPRCLCQPKVALESTSILKPPEASFSTAVIANLRFLGHHPTGLLWSPYLTCEQLAEQMSDGGVDVQKDAAVHDFFLWDDVTCHSV